MNREAQLRGCRNGSLVAARERRAAAKRWDAHWASYVVAQRVQGLTLRAIAGELMRHGIWTRRNCRRWTAAQVSRIIERALDDAPERIRQLEGEAANLRTLFAIEREDNEDEDQSGTAPTPASDNDVTTKDEQP